MSTRLPRFTSVGLSFLAKIPADVAFTFQTIDKDGMVLNMTQTWHQVRPGEIRNNCGGCHAHSQLPTPFEGFVMKRGFVTKRLEMKLNW